MMACASNYESFSLLGQTHFYAFVMNPTAPDSPEPSPPQPPSTPTSPTAKTNWPLFYGLLFGPATLSLLAIACKSEAGAIILTIYGSPVAGLACATIYSKSRGGPVWSHILRAFFFGLGLTVVAFSLCFLGCVIGQAI